MRLQVIELISKQLKDDITFIWKLLVYILKFIWKWYLFEIVVHIHMLITYCCKWWNGGFDNMIEEFDAPLSFFFISNKQWINVSHFRGDPTLIQNTRPLTFFTTHTPPTPKYLNKSGKNRLQPSLLYPNKTSKHHLHTDQRINTPIREGKDCILRLGSNPSPCL